jgi:hypothetical protein
MPFNDFRAMKRIGSIVLGLLAAVVVRSQPAEFSPEWSFGLNGGATLSSVGFLPSVPQTLLVQEAGGLTARYVSEKGCGLQIELNYALRGWKERVDTVSHFNRYSRSLAYIEMPVLTHFYFAMGKRTRVVINLGPHIAYNIGERVLEKAILAPPGGGEATVPDYYDAGYRVWNRFDYGIAGGLGMEVRTGAGNFVIEGRYGYSLSDVFANGRHDLFQSSHNQVIGIKLTWLLRR